MHPSMKIQGKATQRETDDPQWSWDEILRPTALDLVRQLMGFLMTICDQHLKFCLRGHHQQQSILIKKRCFLKTCLKAKR